jgi:hypothetical protein
MRLLPRRHPDTVTADWLHFSYDLETLASVHPPTGPYTQVSELERALLFQLCAFTVTGAGEVVDLGAGAGGSTLAMAAGLRVNSTFDRTLRAFDYFRTGKGTFASKKFHHNPEDTGSFLEDFEDNLSAYSDLIKVHSGNICRMDLGEVGPIELLHVDIAKTAGTFSCVVRDFFPRLILDSVVLHQDFAGPRLPWLHYSTAALLPYIELFDSPVRSTLPFRLVKPIPETLIKRLVDDDFTPRQKISLIDQMQRRVADDLSGGVPFGPILQLSKAFVWLYAEQPAKAWKIAEPLRTDPYLARTRTDHFEQILKATQES